LLNLADTRQAPTDPDSPSGCRFTLRRSQERMGVYSPQPKQCRYQKSDIGFFYGCIALSTTVEQCLERYCENAEAG
jgi:hypothetical protein